MRLTSRSGKHSSKLDLPMTSMIDVVFLLLIFFITTSSLIETERELDAGILAKKAANQPADLMPPIVDVVRGRDGFVYRVGSREFTSQAELTNLLSQFDNKLESVFVRVSDDAPFGMAAAAIQAFKDAHFVHVVYRPLEP